MFLLKDLHDVLHVFSFLIQCSDSVSVFYVIQYCAKRMQTNFVAFPDFSLLFDKI